jgi:CheY-like chemotaxis protein
VEVEAVLESRDEAGLTLHFLVRDTGIGIPKDKHQVIFDAFSQGDGSVTREYGGTGLGLAISRRLVEQMNGSMWLESEPDLGSFFHFLIQLEPAPPAYLLTGALNPTLAGTRVLVVDKNATNRRVLVELLREWGMTPMAVSSGQEAVELMLQTFEPFPLILTDTYMPEVNGAVVMLIASQDRSDKAVSQRTDIAASLTKPVRRMELSNALTSALASLPSSVLRTQTAIPEPRVVEDRAPRKTNSLQSLRVLLTEDNLVNQRVASRLLEKEGHTVFIANNGVEALRACEESTFDLILMDVQMPQMDGLETTSEIRRREKKQGTHIPIIAMTAHAMADDRDRCMAAGMDAYISKPIDIQFLFETIEKHCPHPLAESNV